MILIDYVILIIFTISFLVSLKRGLIKELISLLVWVLLVYVLANYTDAIANYYNLYFANKSVSYFAAILSVVLGLFIIGKICKIVISPIVQNTWFGFFDKVIGVIFGFARGALLSCFLLLMLNFLHLNTQFHLSDSYFAPFFDGITDILKGYTDSYSNSIVDTNTMTIYPSSGQ